jgi:hypothetical protein
MPIRVIAFLLCVVMLWSAVGTIEVPPVLVQPAPAQQQLVADAAGPAATHEGSVEHHHLDDLPSQQAHTNPATETPGMLPDPLKSAAQPAVAPRRTVVAAGVGSPCLAGPLRPPCVAALAG